MAVRKKSYDNEKDFRFKLDMKNRKVFLISWPNTCNVIILLLLYKPLDTSA